MTVKTLTNEKQGVVKAKTALNCLDAGKRHNHQLYGEVNA